MVYRIFVKNVKKKEVRHIKKYTQNLKNDMLENKEKKLNYYMVSGKKVVQYVEKNSFMVQKTFLKEQFLKTGNVVIADLEDRNFLK